MNTYKYRPIKFYSLVFLLTWAFWVPAAFIQNTDIGLALMFFGLCVPAVTAVCMVMGSKNNALKSDFKRKLLRMHQIHPANLVLAILIFIGIVAVSIVASVLFAGQSWNQFAIVDFSFSINGTSALLTILLASVIEEVGWRGYGEDAIASYCSWFKESILFGIIWSCWHIPMFFIPGTYHAGLVELGQASGVGPLFVINFLVSVVPLGFITTWVYVKNNRSMLACIVFHLFVNFMQEKIAMTAETKCVETIVIAVAAAVIVLTNKDMFFETKHVGNLLGKQN